MQKIMFNDKCGLTKAVIDGRKTMTRRTEQCLGALYAAYNATGGRLEIGQQRPVADGLELHTSAGLLLIATRYKPGETVAVAQSYQQAYDWYTAHDVPAAPLLELECYAGESPWTNKMFVRADLMPHRIRITGIRVERLQDISDRDCLREGVAKRWEDGGFTFEASRTHHRSAREAFAALIDEVAGKGTWESNPFVVAYTFE